MNEERRDAGNGRAKRFELLRSLVRLKEAFRLFPQGHPSVTKLAERALDVIRSLTAIDGRTDLTVLGGELFVNGYSLRRESLDAADLVQDVVKAGLNSVQFDPAVQADELVSLVAWMAQREHASAGSGVFGEELEQRGVQHIHVARIVPLEGEGEGGHGLKQSSEYQKAVKSLEQILSTITEKGAYSGEQLQLLVQGVLKRAVDEEGTLAGLLNIKQYEDVTFRHSVNVAVLSLMVGRQLSLGRDMSALLGEAALVHDIGKTIIPREIITKPGRLDRAEWEIISRHPLVGAEILLSVPGIHPLVPRVALAHHVRYDGGGYPAIKVNGDTACLAQVVSVCDVYDAITTVRSYRQPVLPTRAVLYVLGLAGTHFHRALTKAFVRAVGLYPVGTRIHTNHGETAVVAAANPDDPWCPRIRIVQDNRGVPVEPRVTDTVRRSEAQWDSRPAIAGIATRGSDQ